MRISYKPQGQPASKVLAVIESILELSRFSANLSIENTSRRQIVKIDNVRLRQNKAYCGNHPNACENGGTREEEQPHRKSKYLEGADWVEFNDLINDILDRFHLDARFESSQMIMRVGTARRTHYGSIPGDVRGWVWDKIGVGDDFEDFCGETAPDSTFPEGTPGQYKDKYFEVG